MPKVVKVEQMELTQCDDVVITLDDGRIIHVTPEFNAINIFKNQEEFDELNTDDAITFDI